MKNFVIRDNLWDDIVSKKQFYDLSNENKKIENYDIVLPLKNSTPLFYQNLCSWYRHIPINNILVGDAGSGDDSIEIVKNFPRVKFFNHKEYLTSGYSIKKLIEQVETKYFFYLHCDVFIDKDSVKSIFANKNKADWIEGSRVHTIFFAKYANNYDQLERSFSGLQFGNTDSLKKSTLNLDDGYCQRSEDIVIAEMVKNHGFKFYKDTNSVHYHQVMNKKSYSEPELVNIKISKQSDNIYDERTYRRQALGIIKYCKPKKYLVEEVAKSLFILKQIGKLDLEYYRNFAKVNNPEWKRRDINTNVGFFNKLYACYNCFKNDFNFKISLKAAKKIIFILF